MKEGSLLVAAAVCLLLLATTALVYDLKKALKSAAGILLAPVTLVFKITYYATTRVRVIKNAVVFILHGLIISAAQISGNIALLGFRVFAFVSVILSFSLLPIASDRLSTTLQVMSLTLYLVFHFVARLKEAFGLEPLVFVKLNEWMEKIDGWTNPYIRKNKNKDNIERRILIIARLLKWSKSQVDTIAKRRRLALHFLAQVVYTILVTGLIFALLYKIMMVTEPESFTSNEDFVFLAYYSMSHFFAVPFDGFVATGDIAMLVSSLQGMVSYVILAVLFFGFTNISINRFTKTIGRTGTLIAKNITEVKAVAKNQG
jgi:hypothetical protein